MKDFKENPYKLQTIEPKKINFENLDIKDKF
jgi:hypothetical protein